MLHRYNWTQAAAFDRALDACDVRTGQRREPAPFWHRVRARVFGLTLAVLLLALVTTPFWK